MYIFLFFYYEFEGDEVLEWNGRSLQGKTFEEVSEVIAESKQEPQVELMVTRLINDPTSATTTSSAQIHQQPLAPSRRSSGRMVPQQPGQAGAAVRHPQTPTYKGKKRQK
jgi:hypothetical protein